jgi:hypothetical protein
MLDFDRMGGKNAVNCPKPKPPLHVDPARPENSRSNAVSYRRLSSTYASIRSTLSTVTAFSTSFLYTILPIDDDYIETAFPPCPFFPPSQSSLLFRLSQDLVVPRLPLPAVARSDPDEVVQNNSPGYITIVIACGGTNGQNGHGSVECRQYGPRRRKLLVHSYAEP